MKIQISITGFSLLLLSLLSACDQVGSRNILDDQLKAGQPYFSIVYSSDFSSRFKLPVSGVVSLPDYLKAVSLEFNQTNNLFTCDLHLYIDSSLDIFFPVAGDYFSAKVEAEQFFISSYLAKDQDWVSTYMEKNSLRVRFESREDVSAEYRFIKTLEYKRIHENFLPGLTIITFDTYCDIFEPDYYPADIWIQKAGQGDYLLGNDRFGPAKQLDKNYPFEIPTKLVEQIQPYLRLAVQKNSERNGL